MKKLIIILSILVPSVSHTQTMWSKSNPPVDTIQADSVVQHILIKMQEAAHVAKNPEVTYDPSTLDPFSCYRSLINRATGTRFWFRIDCDELKRDDDASL